jgi:thioredoxin reductase (NADPH)
MTQHHHTTDIAIIGAGPVGLFTIFQCGMLGMRVHVIDALSNIGGQCTALYPEKPIYDIPAYPSILAGDLIQQLQSQAAPFEPVYHLGQAVQELHRDEESGAITLTTNAQTIITAKAVIIAAGAGCFTPNRPPLAGIESFEGKSVFYMVQNPSDLQNKDIVIAGGGDSALDWAVSLAPLAKSLSLVHRRDQFRGAPETLRQIDLLVQQNKIKLVTPYQLHALSGDHGVLHSVQVKSLNGEEKTLPCDVLLPFFGLNSDLGHLKDWGLDIEQSRLIIDPTTAQTNIAGIYAVGDIAVYPHKLKLILTGFSEAAQAVHHAWHYINPSKAMHFEHSTTKGIMK